METVNHKSDFDFFLKLYNALGDEIGIPDYDWVAVFRTSSRSRTFTASRVDGVYTNCIEDAGRIHIFCNDHLLPPGTLHCDFTADLPNDIYPDGARRVVIPAPLNIELVCTAGQCPDSAEVELLMPYIKGDKGDPFVYEDFTPEQLADLRRPAEDAAGRADASAAKANEATRYANTAADAAMDAAGKALTAAEEASSAAGEVLKTNEAITDAEQIRKEAEKTRVSNEQARGEGESLRKESENDRRTAETERAKSETERSTAEQTRVASESLRVKAESERKSSEESRAATETTRVEAENKRIAKENARQEAESARVKEFDRIKQEAETATSGANSAAEAANKAAGKATEAANSLKEIIDSKQAQLADSEDISISEDNKLSLTERARMQPLIDRATAAGIIFNQETGFFELNGLDDLTADEIEVILLHSVIYSSSAANLYTHKYPPARTLLPTVVFGNSDDLSNMFMYCSRLITIRLKSGYGNIVGTHNTKNLFSGCINLREVYGVLDMVHCTVSNNASSMTKGCQKLEGLYIKNLKVSISMESCPKLRLDCVEYIIANAANTTAITVTVHPDVYAKLTGDTTNDAYNDLTDEEKEQWTALVPLALSKNIAFATV